MSTDATSMEPQWDAPEVAVRTMRVLLLYFEKQHGRQRLERLWTEDQVPLSLAYVEELSNFVSVRFLERLFDALIAASGDPDFLQHAGMHLATPEALGFAYYMLKGFGSPKLCYQQTFKLGPAYNRVGEFHVETERTSSMVFTYRSAVRESNRNLCITRMANFACFPTIWKLPPADIKELQCQVNGADCCRYELRWQTPPPTAWRKFAGAAVGVGMGAVAHSFHLAPAEFALASLGAAGAFAGAWLDARALWIGKEAEVQEQTRGLVNSLQELQRRSDEVFRANVELEQRVQERTHALTDANGRLADALAQQQELDRLKTRFFDNVSHELRTPLTLILLTLESFHQLAPTQSPSFKQHLDRMERSASRLLRLINELLDLAKIGAGKMRLRYQEVDLRDLLRAVLIPFRVLAEDKKLQLELDAPDELDVVQADFEKLDVVFQNLISNALKFTTSGAVTVKVWQDAFYVHASVHDTGAGIAPEDLGIIFDRFAQADSSGTRRIGGTGIGLALVKETVELHGGNVTAHSRLGEGSTFTVAIPRGTAHVREDLRERRATDLPIRNDRRAEEGMLRQRRRIAAQAVTREPVAPAPDPAATAATPGRLQVLVVEDEPELRAFIASSLRTLFDVVEASDGQMGLERARALLPALIVSDVMMPKMSGLQLLSALRSDPKTLDIPVILLTARHDVDAKIQGLGEGANDYVGKPFSPRELIARIEAQLRLREATARIAQTERLAATSLITSGFAHEVRNPLNGLMNALAPLKESLAGAPDGTTAESMLEVIEESGERIRHLAESLLSMVRDAGGRKPVRASETFAAAERALKWKLSSDVRIEQSWDPDDVVLAEGPALTQLWVNLVDNAARALPGRPDGTIRVRGEAEGEELVITLTDNGCGIAPEHLARLFEPFFSTRSSGDGTGLGLALCRRIVVALGGRIDVTSTLGTGTTVTVRLPRAKDVVAEPPFAHAAARQRARA